MLKSILTTVIVTALLPATLSCQSQEATAQIAEGVRSFDEYPLVWLGESYDAGKGVGQLRLRSAEYIVNPAGLLHPEVRAFRVLYGDCEIEPGRTSCPVPLQIEIFDACNTPRLAEEVKGGETNVRGVEAIIEAGGGLWIETADFTVSIKTAFRGTADDVADAFEVANALVGANEQASGLTKSSAFEPRPASLDCSKEDANTPPAESSMSGLTLFIDANGVENGSCNQADTNATTMRTLPGHTVQICVAGNAAGYVDSLDLRVEYNDAFLLGAPEIDCPAAGGGTNCVDDNPDLNDGVAGVGTGWSCTAFGTSQPRADTTVTGGGYALIQCNANIAAPSALLQNGLLATLTLDPALVSVANLSLGESSISRQSPTPDQCGGTLTCTGATVTVQ